MTQWCNGRFKHCISFRQPSAAGLRSNHLSRSRPPHFNIMSVLFTVFMLDVQLLFDYDPLACRFRRNKSIGANFFTFSAVLFYYVCFIFFKVDINRVSKFSIVQLNPSVYFDFLSQIHGLSHSASRRKGNIFTIVPGKLQYSTALQMPAHRMSKSDWLWKFQILSL